MFSESKKNNKNGFSLMELMIVIAIIGIMTSIVLVYSGKNKIEKEVEGAAREVAAAIREAQNNALTGKQPEAGKFPCAYIFSATNDSENYGIQYAYHFSAENDCALYEPKSYASYSLKNGVKFSTGNDTGISFNIPWGTAAGSIDSPIVLTKGSSSYTICVNSAGRVTETKGESCP